MKVDITQMLIIFDELLPATNEELGIYWFRTSRSDGVSITLAFSIYEEYVDIIIRSSLEIVAAGLNLKNCSELRILDEKKQCLEILHADENRRCFLSLQGDTVLEYTE